MKKTLICRDAYVAANLAQKMPENEVSRLLKLTPEERENPNTLLYVNQRGELCSISVPYNGMLPIEIYWLWGRPAFKGGKSGISKEI